MDTASFEPQSDLPWKKSFISGAGNCVEVAITSKVVYVRTSRDQSGPRLRFSLDEWRCFVTGVKSNEFDLPA
jgi:Domain of unknown function (DUF397)